MLGRPAINRETCQRLSPMHWIEQARTPTLFLQGKDHERCPKCQSEELFVTMMCSGNTPAEPVLYPNGSHKFLERGKPSQRLDAVSRLIGWLERWIDHAVPELPRHTEDQRQETEQAETAAA
jgi:dipeptidyl aminopeptidase/acylaminoacyl peptidase